MPKSIVLPINVLVIVTVATVAMLGLIGVYGVGYNPFSSAMGLESVKNLACRQLVFGGCKKNTSDILVNYDANKNGANDTGDTLLVLCQNFFGRSDDKSCRQMCGCVGAAVTGSNGGGISLNPSSGTTSPGGTLTSTVSATRFNSTLSETVSLTLSGCPAGSTCSLSAPNCNANPTCSVTLSMTAGPNPGGPYTITVTGTGSVTGIIKSATYKLTISSSGGPFDFGISLSLSPSSVAQGSTSTGTINLNLISGSTQSVLLSISGCPTGATCSNPSSCSPTCTSAFSITTNNPGTPARTYTISITGTGGSKTHSSSATLTVTSGGAVPCSWIPVADCSNPSDYCWWGGIKYKYNVCGPSICSGGVCTKDSRSCPDPNWSSCL